MTDYQRVMGIDHGERRVGIALSDPFGMFAQPHSIVNTSSSIEQIAGIVSQKAVTKIVVGLPTATDGGIGQQASRVLSWARKMAESAEVPIFLWDESYSTEDILRSDTGRRAYRRGKAIDDLAAARILQDYLDAGELAENEPGQPLEAYKEGI